MDPQNSEIIFLYVTVPTSEVASKLARSLVQENLAACVNIQGEMQSVYGWEGKVQEDAEIALLVKTTSLKAHQTRDRIIELHPFDTPCIAALPVSENGSNPVFLEWIRQTTNP